MFYDYSEKVNLFMSQDTILITSFWFDKFVWIPSLLQFALSI